MPERLMASVSLDVFAMHSVAWHEKEYDCIFLCVDSLSGWTVAFPTTKLGLTAEFAAHLMLENGWGPFGVPHTITSDQGAQFVGEWWRTMCARLGIRQCYSQSYRPQANGRAERGGKKIINLLQKIHQEDGVNWVEGLPRALQLHHDMTGECGMSPYQIMFGRDRTTPGVPYTPERECESAVEFFQRMEWVDGIISTRMNEVHKHEMEILNKKRKVRDPFQEGDKVWVRKPPSLSSQAKLETRWSGPMKIIQRRGESSY